jgi:hypothetical protein
MATSQEQTGGDGLTTDTLSGFRKLRETVPVVEKYGEIDIWPQ